MTLKFLRCFEYNTKNTGGLKMQLVKAVKELDKALKEENASTIMKNATKIEALVKNQNVFLQKDGEQEVAFITKWDSIDKGEEIVTVPLMDYCKGNNNSERMSDELLVKFIKAKGEIIKK